MNNKECQHFLRIPRLLKNMKIFDEYMRKQEEDQDFEKKNQIFFQLWRI
jgi:hypothetical protein